MSRPVGGFSPSESELACVMSLEVEAAELCVALQLGLVSSGQVVDWADNWILQEEVPKEPLLDVALMLNSHPQDILGELRTLAGAFDTLEIIPKALRRAKKVLSEQPELGRTLARGLYQIYVDEQYDVPEHLSAMSWFDDAFDLARSGIGNSEAEVLAELRAFTGRVADAR